MVEQLQQLPPACRSMLAGEVDASSRVTTLLGKLESSLQLLLPPDAAATDAGIEVPADERLPQLVQQAVSAFSGVYAELLAGGVAALLVEVLPRVCNALRHLAPAIRQSLLRLFGGEHSHVLEDRHRCAQGRCCPSAGALSCFFVCRRPKWEGLPADLKINTAPAMARCESLAMLLVMEDGRVGCPAASFAGAVFRTMWQHADQSTADQQPGRLWFFRFGCAYVRAVLSTASSIGLAHGTTEAALGPTTDGGSSRRSDPPIRNKQQSYPRRTDV